MFSYIWPLALVVLSNVVYQVCTKSVPDINPLASLTVTYFIGALISLILFFALYKDVNLIKEYAKINWASIVLGISIVGLEVGFIYAYRAGWNISTASIVQSVVLTIALIFVGIFAYKEKITATNILGIVICLIGLIFINKK